MGYEWRFVNGSNTYGPANIVSGSLTEGLFTEVSFGNVIAKQLNLKLWNVTIDPSSPIVLSYKAPNSSSWTAKGTYLIDTVSTSPYSEYAEVTAFDAILKAEAIYMKEGTWEATSASSLVADIASIIGVSVDFATTRYLVLNPLTIDQAPNIGENGTTCRQILSVIGALYGGNFFIDNVNNLKFAPLFATIMPHPTQLQTVVVTKYTESPTVVGNEVVNFDKSDAEMIFGIEFQANGGESFRYPSGLTDEQWEALDGRILYNNLPFMASQEAVNRVGAKYIDSQLGDFYGIPYVPYKADTVYAAPNLVLGSGMQIKDTVVEITNRTTNIDALASCDLSAETSRKAESYYPYLAPQVREARQKAAENYSAITLLPTQIMSEVYTKGETDERISTQVTQSATEITTEFTREIGDAVGEANQYTDQQTQVVRSYITEFDDGTNVGIELGRSDSPFKARLTNEQLSFTGKDGRDAAWINNNQLNINEAVIQTDTQFPAKSGSGKWVQQVASNNHFQIRWIG